MRQAPATIAIAVAAAAATIAPTLAFTPVTYRANFISPTGAPSWSPQYAASTASIASTTNLNRRRHALRISSASDDNASVNKAVGDDTRSVGGGTATMPEEIFNLVKSIVGAGVLSLPAGIAAFSNAPSGAIPAVGLIAAIGMFSAYGFSLIGRVCSYTGATSYREAWANSVGEKTASLPTVSCTFMTTSATLAYSMILADTFKSLFATAGMAVTRTQSLFGITSLVLFPLCLLKNLSSLAPFSLLGIAGMLYTTFAMGIRYFGKTYLAPAGKFLPGIAKELQPAFGSTGAMGVLNPNSFILICMLSTAYMAHFNAPKFYNELKDNTVKRYNTVVASSFGVSIFLMAVIGALGFMTFGAGSSPLILNNYSTKDGLMSLSRIAVALSLVFSYPLAFAGLRDGFMDMAGVSKEKKADPAFLNKVTTGLLGGVTGLALVVKDLGFVMSFGGATLGNALIYVFPALMFRKAVKDMGDKASRGLRREVWLAMLSGCLGIVMGGIGATMAVKSIL